MFTFTVVLDYAAGWVNIATHMVLKRFACNTQISENFNKIIT